MRRFIFLSCLLLFLNASIYATGKTPPRQPWYERALGHINPANKDYGAMWEERKQQLIRELGDSQFRYSLAATGAVILLLIIVTSQRVSHRRAMANAVQSIHDVVEHDRYAREVAQEAIRKHNAHMETCNRMIEASRERAARPDPAVTAEVQRLSEQLLAMREENKTLREDNDKKSRMLTELSLQVKKRGQSQAQIALEFAPDHIARINELEKQLAAEKEKNQRRKGTPVDAHRS